MKPSNAGRYAGLQVIVCCLIIATSTFGTYLFVPAKLHYRVTERYTISELDRNADVYLGILIPVSRPYQTIDAPKIEWEGVTFREINASGEEIRLEIQGYTNEAITAEISYEMTLQRGKVNWETAVTEAHTQPQFGIESDNKELISKASQITSGKGREDVKRIYNFVVDNIDYHHRGANWAMSSAMETYRTRSGICTGIARLMVALCRSAEIPTQVVHGIVIPDMFYGGHSDSGESHAWVEFFSEGEWGSADPTWGSRPMQALQFNRSDGLHVSYGEFDQERWDFMDIAYWAASSANLIEMENGYKKYVAASSKEEASIEAEKIIYKMGDSRWAAVLLVWALSTLCALLYRNHFLLSNKQRPRENIGGEE